MDANATHVVQGSSEHRGTASCLLCRRPIKGARVSYMVESEGWCVAPVLLIPRLGAGILLFPVQR